jgi:hypothetical protein
MPKRLHLIQQRAEELKLLPRVFVSMHKEKLSPARQGLAELEKAPMIPETASEQRNGGKGHKGCVETVS